MTTEREFTEFYVSSFGQLTAQLHAFTGDHAEAQDLVQEAFCRAYARWERVSTLDDPLAWTRRVAWNMAISRWRRAQRLFRWRRDIAPAIEEGPSPTSVDLTRALARLPAHHRQAIVLHYLADMPIHEIATFVGVAQGTVKAWLHRGRSALNGLLATEDREATGV